MDRTTLHALMEQAHLKKITQTSEGFACLCPFHDNQKSPAFNINAETGAWKCWNPACGQKGGLVQFLVKALRMDYNAALEYAKHLPTLSSSDPSQWRLPEYDKRQAKGDGTFMDEAQLGMYSFCPTYMVEKRGFPKAFLREYDVGFDFHGYEHPPGSGKMMGANRVTFPVRDPHGRLLGCTRRAVEDDFPKVLHDFETSRTLYLMDRVRPGSIMGISEGPIDALRCRLIGARVPGTSRVMDALRAMTATLGAGLVPAQADLVAESHPAGVVLALDNDGAGVEATRRSIKLLRERGVGRVEVLSYPGKDPGDLKEDDHVDLDLLPTYRWLAEH